MVSEEADQLRVEVARLAPGRQRKYSAALRRRILAWVDVAKQVGMSATGCGKALGIPKRRFEVWRQAERRAAARATGVEQAEPTVAMVPVQTPSTIHVGSGLCFMGRGGCRVEGLTLDQALVLLREFE